MEGKDRWPAITISGDMIITENGRIIIFHELENLGQLVRYKTGEPDSIFAIEYGYTEITFRWPDKEEEE